MENAMATPALLAAHLIRATTSHRTAVRSRQAAIGGMDILPELPGLALARILATTSPTAKIFADATPAHTPP